MVKKFRFKAHVTCSIHTDVEAETEEEARVLAEERGTIALDEQGTSGSADYEWVLEEADGAPENVELQGEVDDE